MFAMNFAFGLKNYPEMIALLKKAFEDKCPSNSSIKKLRKKFKDRKSVHDAL